MAQKKNSLRIIGGIWRSRRIQFAEHPEIRPTPDRVRETLFNWIASSINNAVCLDLFAGSGALGFEAASRGAKQVILIEKDKACIEMLENQRQLLKAEQIEILPQDALTYLQQTDNKFNLVFLDPPFKSELLSQSLQVLIERNLLRDHGFVYIEIPAKANTIQAMQGLECVHEKTAGQVKYTLFQMQK